MCHIDEEYVDVFSENGRTGKTVKVVICDIKYGIKIGQFLRHNVHLFQK